LLDDIAYHRRENCGGARDRYGAAAPRRMMLITQCVSGLVAMEISDWAKLNPFVCSA
jgi:hypothetical protein